MVQWVHVGIQSFDHFGEYIYYCDTILVMTEQMEDTMLLVVFCSIN